MVSIHKKLKKDTKKPRRSPIYERHIKHRVAEDVVGWNRSVVEVGIQELQPGILCVNDISTRNKPKTEEKDPKLLAEIRAVIEPHSETESHLRTTLLYRNMTALDLLTYRLVFLPGLSNRGLCELLGSAPFGLFKDRQVLIQAQSSVMANSLILQIDVWSQAYC